MPGGRAGARARTRQRAAVSIFLLAFPALLSIINPLGGAFIFLGAVEHLPAATREYLARWVAIYSFAILNVSLYVGGYVLEFFGISIPVLRVAGGLVIALSAWNMLNADDSLQKKEVDPVPPEAANRIAFYPLTMPITAGPGTISVAVSLGTNRPDDARDFVFFFLGATLATALISLLIYWLYRSSDRVSRAVGSTGTTIIVRLSAFLLFCIGIQVIWLGAQDLLRTL
jgi:multiple antibiotic resistance protein